MVWVHYRLQSMMLGEQTNSRKFRFLSKLQKHPWLFGPEMQAAYVAACLVVGIASGLGIYFSTVVGSGQGCSSNEMLGVLAFEGLLSLACLAVSAFCFWDVKDILHLKTEFTIVFLVGVPTFPLWFIAAYFNWSGGYSANFWVALLENIYMFTSIWMPIIFTFLFERSPARKVSIADREIMEDEFLYVLVEETTLGPSFEQFTMAAWAIENLLFHRRVDRYKQLREHEWPAEGARICEEFIGEGANMEVNVDMTISEEIRARVKEGKFTMDLFDEAQKTCVNMLRFSVFPLWKSSNSFKELLRKHKAKDLTEFQAQKGDKLKNTKLQLQVRMSMEVEDR